MIGLLGLATGWSNQELHLHLTAGKERLENSSRLPWGHPPVGTWAESASQSPLLWVQAPDSHVTSHPTAWLGRCHVIGVFS